MNLKKRLGIGLDFDDEKETRRRRKYIDLKLESMGIFSDNVNAEEEVFRPLIEHYREKDRLLSSYLCPVDQRIQDYVDEFLQQEGEGRVRLPAKTFILDQYGLARELSLPREAATFTSEYIQSHRIQQGVLHNPRFDRRTTKGTFHLAGGGLPVPPDKKMVPKHVWGHLLRESFKSPKSLQELPYFSRDEKKVHLFVSLLLRPIVVPEVKGFTPEKRMEIRFFVPGGLVSNLDFVESIFGNGGDPLLYQNNVAFETHEWTGHTGCVILAPHLSRLTKKEVGLPPYEKATERERREGMCWQDEKECYNEGRPFKATACDDQGRIVTIIADNYFGYSKKEVKAQISYAANLYGLVEEEHAGGALAFPSYNLGADFLPDSNLHAQEHSFSEIKDILGDSVEEKEEGYGIDRHFPHIFYLPEDATISLKEQRATWRKDGQLQTLKILQGCYYLHPAGYKVHMEKHPTAPIWYLVGTVAEGLFCHKPCTVSGGGKSEISKSIWDSLRFGPVYVGDLGSDMNEVEKIIERDYTDRYKEDFRKKLAKGYKSRSILSSKRSLGSVIKILSPSTQFTKEYNAWVKAIPGRIKELVFLVKRLYNQNKGRDWREPFSVNIMNHEAGHELHHRGEALIAGYLRVGTTKEGAWILNKLRQDYMPAVKVPLEDDITASITVPTTLLQGKGVRTKKGQSVKFAVNCESRFFQRPDDAVVRGLDKTAEADIAGKGNFLCNFEPLGPAHAKELVEKTVSFHNYTKPMRRMIEKVSRHDGGGSFVASSHPRLVDGVPTRNPRYLQLSSEIAQPEKRYLAEVGMRLFRRIPREAPLYTPVGAVLPGRRNNPADPEHGIRPLAVYGPIHYQELPELFIDFICSLTGKSPSTTGAGSEGALTKGPFNALTTTTDLNNALLSYILTGYNGFTTAAGYIGSRYRVDHDISLLIPELWCRLKVEETDPHFLIKEGHLEKVEDFEYKGKKIEASRLGYRITKEFLAAFLGRLFENPEVVFPEEILKPELQSMEEFVDGVNNIVEAEKKVARSYLEAGSVKAAIPPLKALLHIMAEGHYRGKGLEDQEVRDLFLREQVVETPWYRDRLLLFQEHQMILKEKQIQIVKVSLRDLHKRDTKRENELIKVGKRLEKEREALRSPCYLESLVGTIGRDPLYRGD